MAKSTFLGAEMIVLPVVVSLSFLPFLVKAEDAEASSVKVENTFAECLVIQNNLNRLRCYDDASGFTANAATEVAKTSGQGWSFVELTDDFTGRETSSAVLESNRAGQSMTRGKHPVELYVKCDGEGGADIIVRVSGYIGNDRVPVRYKFGDDEPIIERWMPSTTGTAIFLPSGFRDFRSGLETGRDFVFEVTDYRGTSYSAAFEGAANSRDLFDYAYGGCK